MALSAPAFTQNWAGILDPSRATDWTQAGIPGGIPSRSTICQTVAPSGLTDSTDMDDIDAAIANCDSGEVVQLEAGTYTITQGLTFGGVSNVTLRGAGPDKTKLIFTGLYDCGGPRVDICVMGNEGWADNYARSTTWTGGYAQGTSTLTVGSTTGLSAGQIIILDQRSDEIAMCPASGGIDNCSGVSGATESGSTVTITTSIPHGYSVGQTVGVGGTAYAGYRGWFTITAVPSPASFQYTDAATGLAASGGGYVTEDTGGDYLSGIANLVTEESPLLQRTCPDSGDPSCAPGEISRRPQWEIKRVTAIDGNQITIDPPIELTNWRASRSPAIWWTGKNYDTMDGIEDLTYDMTADGGNTDSAGIDFKNAYECWARNVRGIKASRNDIWIVQSARIEVVDSYFFGNKGSEDLSYGVETYGGSDNLVENNICQHVVTCVMTGQANGSVYAYNYSLDSGYYTSDWLMPLVNMNHDYSFMNLFEGNDSSGVDLDNVHGTGAAETVFRNRLRGQDTPAKTNSLVAVTDNAYNRAESFVANVLGTPGAETRYQSTGLNPSGYIWDLNSQAENYSVRNDPVVSESLLRWGNYDTVTGAVRWCGDSSDPGWSSSCGSASEVPNTGITFFNGNEVPSTTTLPASFYLSAQPAFWQTFWGTPPWPAIGPDVNCSSAAGEDCNTPADGVSGYSYYIPAQLCELNTPVDSSYQRAISVAGATWSGGTATLSTAPNTLQKFDTLTVSGVSPAGYDGTFEVTATTATSVSYALPTNPGTYAASGTVNYPNILLYNASNCYPAAYPASGVLLVTTLQSLTFNPGSDVYVATLNITNTGSTGAQNVEIAGAWLGVTQTSGALPLAVGSIANGSQETAIVDFPASSGAAGSHVALIIVATYTGGSSSAGFQVALP